MGKWGTGDGCGGIDCTDMVMVFFDNRIQALAIFWCISSILCSTLKSDILSFQCGNDSGLCALVSLVFGTTVRT